MNILDHAILIFTLSILVLWASAELSARFLGRILDMTEHERDIFGYILGASLTLLGLIIGFTFSMAIGRYDQRKNLEEEEANAIGTEYLRVEMVPDPDAKEIQSLLRRYLDQRIVFYRSLDQAEQQETSVEAELQSQLWSAVKRAALPRPTPLAALAISGMNDVLNSQGYTQAAWRNRIPRSAWALMAAIAIYCNLLIGFASRHTKTKLRAFLLLALPVVLTISFLLVADIDSPRRGLIRIRPQNLESLAQSLR